MIKYKAILSLARIDKIEIAKETEKTVFLSNGRKANKVSDYASWHDTWEDARQHLLREAEEEAASLRLRLQRVNGKLENIKGMTAPEEKK